MLPYFFISIFCMVTSFVVAQTKLIAHKSHSGSVESFRFAYENNSPDLENSDFGRIMEDHQKSVLLPEKKVLFVVVDSVIFVSDSVSVVVSSQYFKKAGNLESKATFLRTKTDTVFYHSLLSKKHGLDSIKPVLKFYYEFSNPVDKIKFIGYDNETDSLFKKDSINCNTRYVLAPSLKISQEKQKDNSSVIIIGIAAFSLLSGTLSWMLSKNRC